MALMEEVKKLIDSGMSDSDIVNALEGKGYSHEEASNAVAQTKIRYAVTDTGEEGPANQEMQPSVLSSNSQPQVQEAQDYQYPAQQAPDYAQYQQQGQDYAQYPQYSYSASSSDAVSEIAEQIVSEKLSPMKNLIEKSIDVKNTMETKLNYIDERLRRLERIIDSLQASILDKVSSQLNGIDDIKRELIETQKTFKAMSNRK